MNVFSVQIKTKRARPFRFTLIELPFDKLRVTRLRFTLIELLVVVAIMGIILAVGLPAFEKLTIGSGVDAAVRQVSAQLRLARQYAISNRRKVAVIIPADQADINAANRFACFRPAILKRGSNDWEAWVPNTTWTFFPVGTVVFTSSSTLQTISNAQLSNTSTNKVPVPGIIFKSTGALDGTTLQKIVIGEGFYASGSTPTERGAGNKNKLKIMINAYTGKTEIKELSESD